MSQKDNIASGVRMFGGWAAIAFPSPNEKYSFALYIIDYIFLEQPED
jgi:hypothetical protein